MTIYNLLIPEERKNKETGEVTTFWHRCGTMFENKGAGFTAVIPEGMSLSGKVVILPRGEKEPESASEAFNEGDND